MIYLIAIIFIMFFMTFYGTSREDQTRSQASTGLVIARQMVVQHAAAVRVCQLGTCPVGEIDSSSQLPLSMVGQPPFAAATGESYPRVRSLYDGTFIITYYNESLNAEVGKLHNAFALSNMRSYVEKAGYYGFGYYKASTNTIFQFGYNWTFDASTKTYKHNTYNEFTFSYSGAGVPMDGAPVIATKL